MNNQGDKFYGQHAAVSYASATLCLPVVLSMSKQVGGVASVQIKGRRLFLVVKKPVAFQASLIAVHSRGISEGMM